MASRILVSVVIVAHAACVACYTDSFGGSFGENFGGTGGFWDNLMNDPSPRLSLGANIPSFSSSPVLSSSSDLGNSYHESFSPNIPLNERNADVGFKHTTFAQGSTFEAEFSDPKNGASATLTASQNVGEPSIGGLQISAPLFDTKTTKVVATGETNFGQENNLGLNYLDKSSDVTAFLGGKQTPGNPIAGTVGGSLPFVNTDSIKLTVGGQTALNGPESTLKFDVLDKSSKARAFYSNQQSAEAPASDTVGISFPITDSNTLTVQKQVQGLDSSVKVDVLDKSNEASLYLSQKQTGGKVVSGIGGSYPFVDSDDKKITITGDLTSQQSNIGVSYKNMDSDATAYLSGTHTNGESSSVTVGGTYPVLDKKDFKVNIVGEGKFEEGGEANAKVGLQVSVPLPQ